MACSNEKGIQAATSFCCAFILSLVIAFIGHLLAAVAALTVGIILFFTAGRLTKNTFHVIFAANFFIILIWLTVPWTVPGTTLYKMGYFTITQEGIKLALVVSIKANAIILVFMGLMGGMTPMKLAFAFAQMGISHKLALMIVFSGVNIEILKKQWQILHEGALLKSFHLKTSIYSWKTIGAMMAFLLVRASDRADLLHEALLLKSFNGQFPVCCPWRFKRKDLYLIVTISFCVIVLLVLDLYVQ